MGCPIAAALVSIFLGERVAPSFVGIASRLSICCRRRSRRCSTRLPCMLLAPSATSYGRLRLLQSLSYAIAAFIAGFIYDRAGYGEAALVFPATAVALQLFLQAVPDPPRINLGARAFAPATSSAGASSVRQNVEPDGGFRPGPMSGSAASAARFFGCACGHPDGKRGIAGGQRVPAFASARPCARRPPSLRCRPRLPPSSRSL